MTRWLRLLWLQLPSARGVEGYTLSGVEGAMAEVKSSLVCDRLSSLQICTGTPTKGAESVR